MNRMRSIRLKESRNKGRMSSEGKVEIKIREREG